VNVQRFPPRNAPKRLMEMSSAHGFQVSSRFLGDPGLEAIDADLLGGPKEDPEILFVHAAHEAFA